MPRWIAGSKTFSITLETAGSWTVTATNADSGGIATDTSPAITVNPGSLDHFVFDSISSPQTAGVDFTIKITAYDAYNNVKTNYAGTAALTESNGGTITPASAAGWVNGVWQHVVNVSKAGTGVYLHAAASPASNNSNGFEVGAGPLHQLTYQHSLDGTAWTTANLDDGGIGYRYLRIRLLDAYGNPLANLGASPLAALDLDINHSEDGGAYSVLEIEAVPGASTITDADGYVTFGGFQFLSGALFLSTLHVWADANCDEVVDLTEVRSNTLTMTFE